MSIGITSKQKTALAAYLAGNLVVLSLVLIPFCMPGCADPGDAFRAGLVAGLADHHGCVGNPLPRVVFVEREAIIADVLATPLQVREAQM